MSTAASAVPISRASRAAQRAAEKAMRLHYDTVDGPTNYTTACGGLEITICIDTYTPPPPPQRLLTGPK